MCGSIAIRSASRLTDDWVCCLFALLVVAITLVLCFSARLCEITPSATMTDIIFWSLLQDGGAGLVRFALSYLDAILKGHRKSQYKKDIIEAQ